MKKYGVFSIAALTANGNVQYATGSKQQLQADLPVKPFSSMTERRCDGCTQCCNGWLRASIYRHEMYPGKPCHYVTAAGCSIYEERPLSPCKKFRCAWLASNSPFPASFKPDLAKFIVTSIQWHGYNAYRLVPAGADPSEKHLEWMYAFSHRTGHPFFYEIDGETIGYGPQNFVRYLTDFVRSGRPLW